MVHHVENVYRAWGVSWSTSYTKSLCTFATTQQFAHVCLSFVIVIQRFSSLTNEANLFLGVSSCLVRSDYESREKYTLKECT